MRRHSRALVVCGFICLAIPALGYAGDPLPGPQDPLPSRLPLLDESALEKFGRSLQNQSTGPGLDEEYPPGTVIPLDTKNLRYFSYFARVQRSIDQSYYYPREGASELQSGVVSISFEINRDGSLGKLKVIGSSGKEILDEAAVTIIQNAAPFSKIPSRINHAPLKVVTNLLFIPSQEAVLRQQGLNLLSIPLD